MTDGMPSYGQIMLSETIGTFILVLTSLSARGFVQRGPIANMIPACLVMAVGLATVQLMFRETSGGIVNPAVVLGKIVWQEFTLDVDAENDNSQWTYEYATSFSIGPLVGAMLGGTVFNLMRYQANVLNNHSNKDLDESQSAQTLEYSFHSDNSKPGQQSPF